MTGREVKNDDARFWHLADIRGTATFCPLLDKSGQRSAQALNAPVVNDPISDTGWALLARRPPVSYAPNYWS
jgi:hypothetical protein